MKHEYEHKQWESEDDVVYVAHVERFDTFAVSVNAKFVASYKSYNRAVKRAEKEAEKRNAVEVNFEDAV